MRYTQNYWGGYSADDELKYMADQGFDIEYVEANKTLRVFNKITNGTSIMLDDQGRIVLKIPRDANQYKGLDYYRARFIEKYCAQVFGFHAYILNRFRKDRLYTCPNKNRYIDWDNDDTVKKYVIDADAQVIVLDLLGNVLHGATPQKVSTARKRAEMTGYKESDW